MDEKSPENEPTEFLVTMNNEIKKCLETYDREIYVKFQANVKSIPDLTSYTQIDAHNSFIFRIIRTLSDSRSILRALLFIIYSPNLSISDLFHALSKLTPKIHPDMFFYKVASSVHDVMLKESTLLEQFCKKLTPGTSRWVHFCIIGKSLSVLPLNDVASVMKSFLEVSLSFTPREFSAVSKFVKGITLPIFSTFLKPFLDRQLLRNIESFVNILPFYLKPLKFCRLKTLPHHGNDYIEAISQACESSNEKLATKAMSIVEIFADHVSPKIFPFNSQSIIPFFKAVSICQSTIDVAFSQLQKGTSLSQNARNALLSFLTRAACQNETIFDINDFIEKYLLNPPQYLFLFLIITSSKIDTKPYMKIISNQNNLLCLSICSFLGTYKLKESDLTSSYIPQSFKRYSMDEVKAYSEILYRIRNNFPDFSSRSYVICTIMTNYQEILLDSFSRAMSDCSDEFKNGLFKSIRVRNPNEVKIFIPILKEYVHTFDASQFVICIALCNKLVSILDDEEDRESIENKEKRENKEKNVKNDDKLDLLKFDENIIVDGLFDLMKNEWKKCAEGALIQLCSHKKCHVVIAKRLNSMLNNLDLLEDNVNILSNLMLNFNIKTDREIFETVFFNTPKSKKSDEIIVHCLSENKRYFQFPKTLCSLLRCSKDGGEEFTRRYIYSMMPKNNLTTFDFLLFLPFYKRLLKTNDYDEICQQIGQILCQFDWVDFEKSDIIDALEDFDESDKVLAHFYAIDGLKDISDLQISRRITKNSNFANCFKNEMDKYGKKFYTGLMAAALTTYNIYVEPLPPFKKYLNYMVSFNLTTEMIIEAVSSTVFHFYRKNINEVVDTVLEADNKRPTELTLGILSKLTSIGNRSQQVFNYLMTLKKSQIIAQLFNEIVQQFLLPEFSDKIIERFLSVPEFNAFPLDTLPSLYNALKTSSKSVSELFELIKSQCKPKISDQTVGILYECLLIIRQAGSSQLTEISNKMLMNYETTKGEYLGLVFHFSNYPNKIKMLEQWITSNNMISKALIVLRYLFTFPSEKSNLRAFLNNLISLTTSNDTRIVESATNALRLAASSLSASMESEITPFIISTILPETSRFELEADLQFLIQVEKKNALILLPFLPSLFLALKSIKTRNNSIDELCYTIENHLIHANDKKPSLYIDIVRMIRNNSSPIEIYQKIDEKIEDTKKDATLTNIAFSMIEADLLSTDLNLKLVAFKILSKLELNDELFEKSESIFYSISIDPHRKEIIPYFITFLDNCSFERKEHIFRFFLEQANKDIKNFQASGFSLLYGTILAKLNDDTHVNNIIEMILNTSNGMVRESLMTSLTEMLDVNKELANKHIIEITSCFLSITNSDINSFHLLKRITSYLSPDVLFDFMNTLISFMNSPLPEVRETTFSIFLILMRNIHPFDNFANLDDVNEKKTFYNLYAATISNFYDYNKSVREKADHLLSLLDNNYKIDDNELIEFVLPFLTPFLTSVDQKIGLLGVYGIAHIMQFVLKDQHLMESIILQWIHISKDAFSYQVDQILNDVFPLEIRPEVSKVIVNLDKVSSLITPTTSKTILFSFIQSRKYLTLIPDAYKKWPTQTSGFIDEIVQILAELARVRSKIKEKKENERKENEKREKERLENEKKESNINLKKENEKKESNINLKKENEKKENEKKENEKKENTIKRENSNNNNNDENNTGSEKSFEKSFEKGKKKVSRRANRKANKKANKKNGADDDDDDDDDITEDEEKIEQDQKLDNLPPQFRFGVRSKSLSTYKKEIESKSADAFINLSVLLANETIVEFIQKFQEFDSDPVMVKLIGQMAEAKPEFFTQYPEIYAESCFPKFFNDRTPANQKSIIEDSILSIVMKLKPMEAGSFFRKISPTFLKLSPVNHLSARSPNVLNDNFISTLINNVFKLSGKSDEMFPDFAYFLSSIFMFISDEIRNKVADLLIKKFISVIVKSENESSSILSAGAADLMCAMRLFSTFIVNNSEVLIISEISACLTISKITPPIQSELISMIECAMSMSIRNIYILRLLQEKVSTSPIVPVFECIAYIIEFSEPPFDEKVLINVWKTIEGNIKNESQNVRISVAKIASLIVQQIPNSPKKRDLIMEEVLTNNPNDAAIYSSFLAPLRSIDILHQNHIENIKRLLSIEDPNSCMFLTLIPKLAYGFDLSNNYTYDSERSARKFSNLSSNISMNQSSLPKQYSHPHIPPANFASKAVSVDSFSSQPSILLNSANNNTSSTCYYDSGLLVEVMNYLVRGVKGRTNRESGLGSSYIVPAICLETIGELQDALRDSIDIKESAVIVSGLYLASCGLQGYLKESAFELLGEILEKGRESPFREKYFKSIDSSLAQAFQRDILSTN